jgi:hypothetical protein
MSAEGIARPLAFLLVSVVLAMTMSEIRDAQPVSATHDGHRIAEYFVLPFIKDVPNTPLAGIPVYDCGGGHEHPGLIGPAVNAWNNTDRVRFFYTLGATTPCTAAGLPTTEGRISVFHNDLLDTGLYVPVTAPDDPFRANDVGTEGDIGMYQLRWGRIRIRVPDGDNDHDSHTVAVMVHELGHAAGLTDICKQGHTHNPDNTIMDCSIGPTPGQHDTDNLDFLYKRAPEQVNDFVASPASTTTITFTWTDRSYTEEFQYIAMVGELYPLAAPRDAESAAWGSLQPNTTYCFRIQPVNAYGVMAPISAQSCATTLLPPPTLTPGPTPQTSVGGIIELGGRGRAGAGCA